MITLITGTPGAGKTLYTVSEELPKYKNRPLYVDGIPNLAITHLEPIGPVEKWHEWIPDGAVLVIDEVQRIWRPRGSASAVPPGVAALETHRHKGVDLIIITQHPNLLDPNIRRLVGRHLHVRRMFGWKRAIVYEWDSATDPNRVATAIKRSWGYPKKAYKLYKSASQHTSRGNRVPITVVLAALAILAVPAGWYYAINRTSDRFSPDEKPVAVAAGDAATEPATARAAFGAPPPTLQPQHENIQMVSDQYDWSSIGACVLLRNECRCYGDSAERLMVPDTVCRSAVSNGWAGRNKNNDNEASPERVAQAEPATPVPPDTISPMGVVARRAAEEAQIPAGSK